MQWNALKFNLKQNWILYFTILFCLGLLSQKSSALICIYSFSFLSISGWYIHWLTHKFPPFRILFSQYDNAITRNPLVQWFGHYVFNILDFHSVTHHDLVVNKSPANMVYEFLNNVLTQAGFLWIIKKSLSWLDNRIILIWGLFYASVHIINYYFTQQITHQHHHINCHTNFGMDIYDIIFGTKYNWENITSESDNHASINLFLLTWLIM